MPLSAHQTPPVGESGRAADDCILQITFLVPGWDDEEEAAGLRRDYTDRNTNLREFRFSTPFTRNNGGPQSTDVLQQCKRNTRLFTGAAFPYLCTRQCVSNRAETVLEPIDSARDDIEQRTVKLHEVLTPRPQPSSSASGSASGGGGERVDMNALQQLLQGMILAQVCGAHTVF